MKQYKIPIVYQRIDYFDVDAENLQDAVNQALKLFMNIPDEYYLEDSFEIDDVVEDEYDETYDLQVAIDNLSHEKE